MARGAEVAAGDVTRDVVAAPTIWGLLAERTARTPDRLMLMDERHRTFTFAQVTAWAERVAAGLAERGIGNGSAVSWQLPTWVETMVLSLALSRLGAVQNPIIPIYREREVGSLLQSTGAELFVVPGRWRGFDYLAMAEAIRAERALALDILAAPGEGDAFGWPEADPTALAPPPADGDVVRWLYATSGTTSEPKAVCHTDGTLIAGGIGLAVTQAPVEGEVGAIVFPYAHIGGPDFLVLMLRCGVPALLLESFVPAEAVVLMNEYGVTMTGGSTAHYLAFLHEQRKQPGVPLIPTLRVLNGGGAPKPPVVFWEVVAELGCTVRHGFGMTESPMIACGAEGDTDEQLAETDGAPVPGCEIRIETDGRILPAGEVGEVLVRGPMLAKGYTDAALTAEAFRADGWFRTGDLGYLRPDGHLVISGREKELIIRKGENISPKELEDVLSGLPGVIAAAVIGLPDAERGERVCAVFELDPGARSVTLEQVRAACETAGLMRQKFPEQVEVVEALPRNATLKILKRELVERFSPA